jgi:TPR repeat protein
MRIISCLILSLLMTLSTTAHAEIPLFIADVSAGVFRFQIKLAEQGNSEAQYKVGEMYEMGKGVSVDIDKAQIWFEKSANQGHKKAAFKLLYLEISSNGLNDFTKSQLANLRSEAAGGSADAQYFLGKMYAAGVGVPKSLTNALTWLNKATYNGIPEAEHEAIAVEEELARIREREAGRRATALAAAQKKKAEEAKARKAKEAKEREQAAKRDAKRRADARRSADKRRRDKEASDLAVQQDRVEQEQLAKERAAAAAEARRLAEIEKKKKAKFVSDPCKGKSARFLSTCR